MFVKMAVKAAIRRLNAMRPLPKWAGWLGAILAVVPTAYEAYQNGGWQAAIPVVVGAIMALFSHSATGNGTFVPPEK